MYFCASENAAAGAAPKTQNMALKNQNMVLYFSSSVENALTKNP
jgi:hypothetical protein